MTDDGAKSFRRKLDKAAYPMHMRKEMDFEQFAKKMGGVNGQR